MTSPQLNLRLSTDDRMVLDAVAFLAGSSATEFARDVLTEHLRRRGQEPRVQAALRLRAEEHAEMAGALTQLRAPARKSQGDGGP